MNCKHCGKEIDAEAHLCEHCGKDLESNPTLSQSPSNSGLPSRSFHFTKKRKIILMIYILWVLVWLVACIRFHNEKILLLGFVCVVGVPLLMLFVWYYVKHLKNKPNIIEAQITKTHPLMDFASQHGKMQMIKDYNKKTNSYDIISYAFTDNVGNVTKVQTSEAIKDWSSERISMNKYSLYVNEYSDGHYVLTLKQFPYDMEDK